MMTAIRQWMMVCTLLTAATVFGQDKKGNDAIKPAPRPDKMWVERNDSFNAKIKAAKPELLFIGDSITHAWESSGKEAWDKYYAPRKAFNLGISGDRTQHILYRFNNGNIDGIRPKLAVIMIGTNNSNNDDNSAKEIADGVTAIVKQLRAKLPKTKVLVLGIFPRGPQPNPQREKIVKVNRIIAKLADGKMVHFLDIGINFMQPDKTISKEIMPDYLHLTPRGYEIWAAAIEGTLRKLLGEDPCSW